MRYVRRDPPDELRPLVRSLWWLRGEPGYPEERVFPMPHPHLIVNLSESYRVHDPASSAPARVIDGAFASGPRSGCLASTLPRELWNLGAELRADALGAWGVDAVEASALLLLDEPAFARMVEVARASDPDDALDALERLLVDRLDASWRPDPVVTRALDALDAEPALDVATLIVRSGVSRDRFVRRFRRAVGIAPKRYRDLLRFHSLVDAVAQGLEADPDWSALAAEHGFADQSHLIRVFRRATGFTPRRYHRIVREYGPEAARFVPIADSA